MAKETEAMVQAKRDEVANALRQLVEAKIRGWSEEDQRLMRDIVLQQEIDNLANFATIAEIPSLDEFALEIDTSFANWKRGDPLGMDEGAIH